MAPSKRASSAISGSQTAPSGKKSPPPSRLKVNATPLRREEINREISEGGASRGPQFITADDVDSVCRTCRAVAGEGGRERREHKETLNPLPGRLAAS